MERLALDAVRGRLPSAWSVALESRLGGTALLSVVAPDRRRAKMLVVCRKNVSPRDVAELLRRGQGFGGTLVVVAPFLGPRTRELLAAGGAGYVDATGNVRIVLGAPAVFIQSQGLDRDPTRQPRALKSLRGAAAGRVVRALCDFAPPYGVRALAEASATPLGTVSRVVSLLEEEALLVRDGDKQVVSVDWEALIRRWARDYGVQGSNRSVSFLEPSGIAALGPKLGRLERCAVTGSLAGSTVAPARLAMVYVDDAEAAASRLGLVPTEAGANVWLLEPYDEVVFERTRPVTLGGARGATRVLAVALSQAVADLLTSPGRGPQEAEALISGMKGSEGVWRRRV